MDLRNHQRYVTIGWAIALAAQPMIQYYFPDDHRPDTVLKHVSIWIVNQIQLSGNIDVVPSAYYLRLANQHLEALAGSRLDGKKSLRSADITTNSPLIRVREG